MIGIILVVLSIIGVFILTYLVYKSVNGGDNKMFGKKDDKKKIEVKDDDDVIEPEPKSNEDEE